MTTQSVARESLDFNILGIFKGVLFSVVITLGLVLIFALCTFYFEVEDKVVPIVNQIIRGSSIFVGCMLSIRGVRNGWLKGFFVGVFYIVFSFLLFSALNQSFELGVNFVNDMVLGGVFGLLSGIVCANIKKSTNK